MVIPQCISIVPANDRGEVCLALCYVHASMVGFGPEGGVSLRGAPHSVQKLPVFMCPQKHIQPPSGIVIGGND